MAAAAGLLAASLAAPAAVAASEGFKTKLTPEEALRALRDGNERFVSDAPFRPEIGTARRTETSKGQGPFASFVSCADSRVSPELVFSRGIGELFVVRSAGNIADAVALGGRHGREERHLPPGSINDVVRPIMPAVQKVRGQQGDLLGNAIRENAMMVAQGMIARSPILQDAVKKDKLRVVAAHYGLANGRVEFLGG